MDADDGKLREKDGGGEHERVSEGAHFPVVLKLHLVNSGWATLFVLRRAPTGHMSILHQERLYEPGTTRSR